MNQLFVILQAASGGTGFGPMDLLPIGLVIVIIYFFMWRPQQKKQKAVQEARNAMKVGDKVLTAGGIHGYIREAGETYFILEIADNVRIKIEKSSVYNNNDTENKIQN